MDQIKTGKVPILRADAEYMRNQLRRYARVNWRKNCVEQIREETRRELETELRESIRGRT
ncbi:MAG: hypothetical protein ACLR1V_04810 [Coprococcus sp.]